MNRIKDFIYNKNDLLVAFLIVAAAAFVIMSRIDIIMAYPTALTSEAESVGSETIAKDGETAHDKANSPHSDGSTDEPDDNGDPSSDPSDSPEQTADTPAVKQISIHIEYGSNGSDIAQILVDSGLISSKQAFYDAISAAGAETKLQAGSFKIPSNASPTEVINIITN